MKNFLAALLIVLTPALALAQADAKASDAKPKAKPSASRAEIKAKAKDLAVAADAAEAALTPAELAIAERVHVGQLPCELGNYVTLVADAKAPGYFNVQMSNPKTPAAQTKALKYRMFPVLTSTGAIRLEDQKVGAVWLQLANKSMLMNHRAGKRLADECMSPVQVAVAEGLKLNPAHSILEPAPVARP
jgi:hypothetical protein